MMDSKLESMYEILSGPNWQNTPTTTIQAAMLAWIYLQHASLPLERSQRDALLQAATCVDHFLTRSEKWGDDDEVEGEILRPLFEDIAAKLEMTPQQLQQWLYERSELTACRGDA